MGIPGKTEGVIFTPVPCQIVYFEPEKVGVSMLQQTKTSEDHLAPIASDFRQIERSVLRSLCSAAAGGVKELCFALERQRPLISCWTSYRSMLKMSS